MQPDLRLLSLILYIDLMLLDINIFLYFLYQKNISMRGSATPTSSYLIFGVRVNHHVYNLYNWTKLLE